MSRFLVFLSIWIPVAFPANLHAAEREPLPASDLGAGHLRVVTYNILGGRNTDGTRDLQRVADVIRALNPDLIALQEVDVKTRRINGLDVPAELAKRTGLTSAFAEAMPYDGGSYGEATLTRLKILKQIDHPLPHLPGHEPRVALELHCEFPGSDRPIRFIGTHLDHLRNNADRVAQVNRMIECLAPLSPKSPAILVGDLNAPADREELQPLLKHWEFTWPEETPGATWPTENPRTRIDHLLIQRNAGWKVVKTFRGNDIFPDDESWQALLRLSSDHVPVILELKLEPVP